MLLEKLKALECSLHGVRRNDRQWLEQLLHPDFQEKTRSGITIPGKEELVMIAKRALRIKSFLIF